MARARHTATVACRRSLARRFSYRKGRFFPAPAEVALATVAAYPPPRKSHMKSIILWLCGVPIGVIILLKVFGVF
jgi:hypothetical protein